MSFVEHILLSTLSTTHASQDLQLALSSDSFQVCSFSPTPSLLAASPALLSPHLLCPRRHREVPGNAISYLGNLLVVGTERVFLIDLEPLNVGLAFMFF